MHQHTYLCTWAETYIWLRVRMQRVQGVDIYTTSLVLSMVVSALYPMSLQEAIAGHAFRATDFCLACSAGNTLVSGRSQAHPCGFLTFQSSSQAQEPSFPVWSI